MLSNDQYRNDYDIGSSQAAQDRFRAIAGRLEAALDRRDGDVKQAMAAYMADGVSDQYAGVEKQWNMAGREIRGIIDVLESSLSQNDDIAGHAMARAAATIPGV